jgi:hypothetical protein
MTGINSCKLPFASLWGRVTFHFLLACFLLVTHHVCQRCQCRPAHFFAKNSYSSTQRLSKRLRGAKGNCYVQPGSTKRAAYSAAYTQVFSGFVWSLFMSPFFILHRRKHNFQLGRVHLAASNPRNPNTLSRRIRLFCFRASSYVFWRFVWCSLPLATELIFR